MAAFLEQMESRYGGVARWLTDHGLNAEELDLLRAKLRHPLPTRDRRLDQVSHGG